MKLTITYDQIGDILFLETVKPYPLQETRHLGVDILGRIHPRTGAVESIEVLFFAKRAKMKGGFELPVFAELSTSGRRPVRRRTPVRKNKGPRVGEDR